MGFSGGKVVKNLLGTARDARDVGSVPGLGRSPGEGNSIPLWYSCLENPMDRGAWRATVHGVTELDTIEQQQQQAQRYFQRMSSSWELRMFQSYLLGSSPGRIQGNLQDEWRRRERDT